jgi:hypothetical protein
MASGADFAHTEGYEIDAADDLPTGAAENVPTGARLTCADLSEPGALAMVDARSCCLLCFAIEVKIR